MVIMDNAIKYWEEQIQLGKSLLGKQVSEIPTLLSEAHEKKQSQINEALSKFKSNPTDVVAQAKANEVWRFGSVSTGGFIRGDLTAHINFGGSNDMTFSGTMWCGPQAIAGGGGGMWSIIPKNNQKMDFHFGAASWVGGELQVYWSIDGTIVGQLVAVVGGAAISGGSGSGKWKKD
jgi:hypothetical protein